MTSCCRRAHFGPQPHSFTMFVWSKVKKEKKKKTFNKSWTKVWSGCSFTVLFPSRSLLSYCCFLWQKQLLSVKKHFIALLYINHLAPTRCTDTVTGHSEAFSSLRARCWSLTAGCVNLLHQLTVKAGLCSQLVPAARE